MNIHEDRMSGTTPSTSTMGLLNVDDGSPPFHQHINLAQLLGVY